MPFTPSHAFVALPFVRTPLVPAAIAIGAMTPDLPLFLRGVGVSYPFTHTLSNIVWTTLIAFVLLLVWRLVLRPALVELAPDRIAAWLPDDWRATGIGVALRTIAPRPGMAGPVLVMVSLMLGVLSHIALDAFTHEGRWGVALIPALSDQWGPLLGYKWMQHGLSLLGLLLLAGFGALWLRGRIPVSRTRLLPPWVRWAWMLSLPGMLVAAWALGLAVHGPFTTQFTPQHLAYRVLPPAAGLWGATTIVLCVAVVLVLDRRRRADAAMAGVDDLAQH